MIKKWEEKRVQANSVFNNSWYAACFRMSVVLSVLTLMFMNASVAADQQQSVQSSNSDRPVVPAGAPSSETGSQYIIGPGDAIQVFVWRNPELSVAVPVRPDGRVSSPLVEDIVAVGKTPSQLARDIEARLADYIKTPQVSIIVNNAVSTYSQIKIIGQVKAPQSMPFREGMTVLDVLLAAGGVSDFAAGNKSKILRKDDKGKETSINVRIEDLVVKGKITENVPVKPGDVIIVPESIF